MFKQKFFSFLFSLFAYYNCYSQNPTIDSLEILLQNPKLHDTTRLAIMSEIIGNSQIGDSTIPHYNKIIKDLVDKKLNEKNLSKKEIDAYKYTLAYWYTDKATELFSKKNASQVLAYYDKAIAIFKELRLEEEMWFTINNKGYALRKLDRYEESLKCFFGALSYHEQHKNKQGVAFANSAIGSAYGDLKQFPKAVYFNNKASQYYQSIKKPSAQDLSEYATILGNNGNFYLNLKQYEKSKENLNKAIRISLEIGKTETIGYCWWHLGEIDSQQHNYGEAVNKFRKGLEFAKTDRLKGVLLNDLGSAYMELKNIPQAKKYLLESKVYTERIKDPITLWPLYKNLTNVYKAEQDYKSAFEMNQKYEISKDSANLQSSRDALLQQQLNYNFEKKELNYKLAAQNKAAVKNNWLIVLSSILLGLLLGGFFYYRNNKQKQAIAGLEKTQMKQRLLITQMNPHFIFNSIENIRALIFDGQNDDAVNYLGKFSKLTRQILENSNENYISLAEEIEMIENYLTIQQLLYNNKFKFNIAVEGTIATATTFLPPMLTQPFIENAVKHGLSNKSSDGMIDIFFYLKENKLFFEVTDNGKGFDVNEKISNHKSLAMAITKERLVTYTKNQHFVVKTDNLTDSKGNITGAKVNFEIPYIYEK